MVESSKNHVTMREAEHSEPPAALHNGVADMNTLEVVYQIIKDGLPACFSKLDFLEHFNKYSFVPVVLDGEIVGAYANYGSEIHSAVLPKAQGKWFSKRVLRWVNDLQSKYGTLTTKVEIANSRGHEFVRRVGFCEVRKTKDLIFYERRIA